MQAFIGVDGHAGVRHGLGQLSLLPGQLHIDALDEKRTSAVSSLPQRVAPSVARSERLLFDP